ncbi:MAG: hypothetical protein C0501_18355 [Isosphaera sp.]|nr:hypothetical protein [Isosphaera sp.]
MPAHSTLVYPGPSGQLLYTPDAQGDRIPDFSAVGYKGGTVAIPTVAVRATVNPGAGDDGARIQAAIDAVSAMPVGADGFRGAVLLTAGEYQINGSVQIRASGVVLRGAGDGTTGTVLRATGTSQRTLVQVSGTGSAALTGPSISIVDKVVPVGAISFRVASPAGLQVGDRVIVRRPSTAEWIRDINMDQLAMPWQPGSKDIRFDRVITRIEGDRVSVDAPLTNSLEQRYGGGTVTKYTWAGRIRNVGVENIRGVSDFAGPTDEAHSWRFVQFSAVENGWARRVTGQHFAYAAVQINSNAKHITVEDSQCLDPVSQVTGGRRYSFSVDGQLNLVRDCYARGGRHDFVMNGATVPGPNVFLDCRADNALSDTGPHQRWITGGLFDNVDVRGNGINVQNRGNSGTGHGWAGANMVVWNSNATGGYVVQNPPTAQNWLIGSTGPIRTGTMFVGPTPQPGVVESHGTRVDLRSLYEAQLSDRLTVPGVEYREYVLGDFDTFFRDGTADDVYVDPAWRAAVDAATTRALVGFDVGTNKTAVPFTFEFSLAPGEQVVGATLSLGLRATGSRTDTDTIRIDSLGNSFSLSSLGLLPLATGATTGRVLDLGSQLALLADGRLNLMISDDTAVDWAILNLRVVPSAAVPLANAGFESPNLAAGAFQYSPAAAGWTFSPSSGVTTNGSGFTGGNPNAPQGDQVAFLQDRGSVGQAVSLAPGTYTLTFRAAQRGNFQPGGPQTVRARLAGTTRTFTPAGTSYDSFSATFTVATAGTYTLVLDGTAGGDSTALVDDILLTRAP